MRRIQLSQGHDSNVLTARNDMRTRFNRRFGNDRND
jgi:hypothetical protein